MVAALYLSPNQSKKFKLGNFTFGWIAIERMFDREAKLGQRRRVPGLKESHVNRDIWTRLNVKPAKIMQVCLLFSCINTQALLYLLPKQRYVLAELSEYLEGTPDKSTQLTLQYLQALNDLFEDGILSHHINGF